MSDFRLRRGDDDTIDIVVWQPKPRQKERQPLAGMTLWFTAKSHFSDADDAAVLGPKVNGSGLTITNEAAGEVSVTIDAADWSKYPGAGDLFWDLQVHDGNDTHTIAGGRVYVTPDVTRTDVPPGP